MIVVTLYVKQNHAASDQAILDLRSLESDYPHQLALVDVDATPEFSAALSSELPVAQIGPYRLTAPITLQRLQVALGAARDRNDHLDKIGDVGHTRRVERGHNISSADRFSWWLSRWYMVVIAGLLILYVGLPFLAPVFARAGATGAARLIYTVYSPLCHQLPFRSWFLWGSQAYYPRELAGIPGVATYEQFTGSSGVRVTTERKFTGVEELGFGAEAAGYKVALCQRDVAIYAAMALFALLFIATGRKIKALPWYLWVLIGLGPIGLDGFSQLPSLIAQLPDWMLIRESTPVLRSLTGGLFGLTTAWYLFPMIEDSMRETRKMLAGKFAVVAQIQKAG
ncbi:MAG TPA: DUF2085 domain-containing protein [Bellilinea sp.]|nr:DUF2085 domain-containing protein [Bellilinea sp.]